MITQSFSTQKAEENQRYIGFWLGGSSWGKFEKNEETKDRISEWDLNFVGDRKLCGGGRKLLGYGYFANCRLTCL